MTSEQAREMCDRLSLRDKQCLTAIASGMTYKEAGRFFDLSPETIRDRMALLRARLNVKSKLQAAVIATKAGLV